IRDLTVTGVQTCALPICTAFTLTVTGTGFMPGSQVQWGGTTRISTYVSSTQMTVAVKDTDLTVGGTAAVTVVNPGPGGGASSSRSEERRVGKECRPRWEP